MDTVKARTLENELRGKCIEEWTVDSLIDHGKSAAVFKGHVGGTEVAIKIFDQELIERYGDASQIARIRREIALKGHHHPHLIKILGGGFDPGTQSYYIVMEYLSGANLRKSLNDIAAEDIPLYAQQLAEAAEFLETLDIVHRDIKPENIIINIAEKKLTLLDLGVILPIGEAAMTDADGIQKFIGTLQYSPPEFLLRKEANTKEGWRAVTFYQIGAVLHDLIMKKPLFAELQEPYAKLVNAVLEVTPVIQSSTVSPDIVSLAECCLLKDPVKRLRLVSWETFKKTSRSSYNADAKMRVSTRIQLHQAQGSPRTPPPASAEDVDNALKHELLNQAKQSFRSVRMENSALPPFTVTGTSDCTLKVVVQANEQVKLPVDFALYIRFEIIDANVNAFEILGKSFAGNSSELSNAEKDPDDQSWRSIFQGTFDATTIHGALENFFYEQFDWAQQLSEDSGDAINK